VTDQQTVSSRTRGPIAARWLPYLALVVGLGGLAFTGFFVRWAGAPGPVAGFYRVTIAAIVMAVPVAQQTRRQQARQGDALHRPSRLNGFSRRHLLLAVLAGVFFSGDLAVWNTSVFMTNVANATLLGNTAPVWVSLGALLLFKEKLGPVFWASLGLAMLGAVVILGGDFVAHPTLGLGDLLATLAGVFYGAFLLTTQRAREGLSALLTWWVAACASGVMLLLISLALRQPITGYSSITYVNLFAAALVTQVAGYISISYALGHLPASIVSPALLAQPVLTALLAIPLLHESISWGQIVGGLLVLGGIWLLLRHRRAPA
jgi:drug/metabolite transporter (DMT)-like permease